MEYLEIVQAIKELGLAGGVLVLCGFLVRYIVIRLSKTVDCLSVNINTLSTNMTTFTALVAREHKQQDTHHEKLMGQHDEITKILGRINGYKE